jgi:hypothetical protein
VAQNLLLLFYIANFVTFELCQPIKKPSNVSNQGTNQMQTTLIIPHPFAHIMDGPYSYAGTSFPESRVDEYANASFGEYVPNTSGSCDCCSTAIQTFVFIKGATGQFKVGTDCAKKATQSPKVLDLIKKAHNDRAAKKRKDKKALEWANLGEKYNALIERIDSKIDELKSQPHPKGFENLSLLNYLEWHHSNSCRAKFVEVCSEYKV